ncbi:hypothetical protein BD408DRAFT_478870 [Parasitella parasitica]|nr:hypothetical protein BD408DRAFT_478870 [Parasitella parasitica]
MLSDTSLINTIILSGISNIRYKCYVKSYPKSSLLSFLTCEGFQARPSYIASPESQNLIIHAYRHLIAMNVPATWHVSSNQNVDKDTISLELWLFWFDNKHTSLIANDSLLKELQGELHVSMIYCI